MTGTVTLINDFGQDDCETAMARRTYESDGLNVQTADDLDELVADKRQGWRANAAKARRRQRRYKKRLTNEIRYQPGITNEVEQD
tara:strand:+ start:172 stop:426 length:255 start_codon:yes stop_codon:yes gene_type:complete